MITASVMKELSSSLNSCDLFLSVLVYMQEQQNYSFTK